MFIWCFKNKISRIITLPPLQWYQTLHRNLVLVTDVHHFAIIRPTLQIDHTHRQPVDAFKTRIVIQRDVSLTQPVQDRGLLRRWEERRGSVAWRESSSRLRNRVSNCYDSRSWMASKTRADNSHIPAERAWSNTRPSKRRLGEGIVRDPDRFGLNRSNSQDRRKYRAATKWYQGVITRPRVATNFRQAGYEQLVNSRLFALVIFSPLP